DWLTLTPLGVVQEIPHNRVSHKGTNAFGHSDSSNVIFKAIPVASFHISSMYTILGIAPYLDHFTHTLSFWGNEANCLDHALPLREIRIFQAALLALIRCHYIKR